MANQNLIDYNENIQETKMFNQDFILNPLSVIIKLAILSNKSIGTKIFIDKNVIYLQEPGPFQAICRYILKTNKTNIKFLYNPLQIACETFLNKESIKEKPELINLFQCAQKGINNLIETYKSSSIMRLCLNYYYVILSNYIDKVYNTNIFRKDNITSYYNNEIVESLNKQWTTEKIKFVLNAIEFLMGFNNPSNYVKSLEDFMDTFDKETQNILN